VLLLEKAWAKLHGSYQQIDLGSSMEALIALTGAPCKVYHKENDNIKKAIEDGFSSGIVVTCSGSDELNSLSSESASAIGLIQRHAYSVQRMIEVVRDGKKQLLVKIRNPWGN
jgi:calpain